MIKLILRLVLILVLLCFIFTGVLLVLLYSGEAIPYTEKPEAINVEQALADDINQSLDKIVTSNYQENYLSITFSEAEINAYLIDLYCQENPNYLVDGNQKVFEMAGNSFNGLFFTLNENKLGAKAYFECLSFYKTNIELKANVNFTDDKKLELGFSDLKIGKGIKISRSFAEKVSRLFNKENSDLEISIEGMEIKLSDLKITIDVINMVSDICENQVINELLKNAQYSLLVAEDLLEIRINTESIINGGKNIFVGEEITFEEVLANFEYELGTTSGMFALEESHFNYLINEELTKDLEAFTQEFMLGNQGFVISFADFYYDFATSKIITNLNINDCATSAELEVEVKAGYNNNQLEAIEIKVNSLIIGQTQIATLNDQIPAISIPITVLSFNDHLKVSSFKIDSNSETIMIWGSIH